MFWHEDKKLFLLLLAQGTQGREVFDLVKLILPSLMFVPLLALILLLVWKVRRHFITDTKLYNFTSGSR